MCEGLWKTILVAARALEELKIDEAIKILVKLPSRLQYLLMERISPQKAGRILEKIDSVHAMALSSSMPPQQASFVLRHMDEGKRAETLEPLPLKNARQLDELIDVLS